MDFLDCLVETKFADDDDSGTFSGYASVYGVKDRQSDIVQKGAFAGSQFNKIRMLWQHKQDMPIGTVKNIQEDEYGLRFTGQIVKKTQAGMEAYELMKAGAVDSMSIGYSIDDYHSDVDYNKETNVRTIKKARLWEVSVVTFPANELATINQVKGFDSVRDFERFLRDAGISNKQAKALASEWRRLNCRDGEDEKSAVEQLSILMEKLKGKK